ncbi:hypothetical protein [Streptomyces sp. NPDC002221]|uniref:hypothetical protein n=1 Tax=Streptomyces sp. NPDC002221 TaxID=3364639 RepID=UPI0036B82D4E
MGTISVERTALNRLIADGASDSDSYQRRYNELGRTHRGQPTGQILPLLRIAAKQARLDFTDEDLAEQARAIRDSTPYALRVILV